LRKLLPKVWWLPFRLGGDFFVFFSHSCFTR